MLRKITISKEALEKMHQSLPNQTQTQTENKNPNVGALIVKLLNNIFLMMQVNHNTTMKRMNDIDSKLQTIEDRRNK